MPACARIVAEEHAHLVVDQDDVILGRDGEVLHALGVYDPGRGDPVRYRLAAERAYAVVDGRHGVLRDERGRPLVLHGAEQAALEGLALLRLRDRRQVDVVATVLVEFDDRAAIRHHSEFLVVGKPRRGGHEVPVGVLVRLAVGVGAVKRIEPPHDFPAVGESVAVGVAVDRACANEHLLVVGETVVVEVARPDGTGGAGQLVGLASVHQRIERGDDVVGGDRDEVLNVGQVEPLAGHTALPDQVAGVVVLGIADLRPVPEPVLVAVGEIIAVGVGLGRVGRTLGRPAVLPIGAVGELEVSCGGRQVCGEEGVDVVIAHVLEAILRNRVTVAVVNALPEHPCALLVGRVVGSGVGTVRVGIAGVEASAEAAEFVEHVERSALRGPGAGHVRRQRVAALVSARQVVLVFIEAHDVVQVVAGELSGFRVVDAEAVCDYHAVGDAVLVDVAAVVERTPFLREDSLDVRLGEAAVLLVHGLRRERHDARRRPGAGLLRGD